MRRLYYEIWADAIDALEKNTKSYMPLKDRIIHVFFMFCLAQGANLLLLLLVIQQYFFDINSYIPRFFFRDFWGTSLISGFIMFFLPFALLNYFLVFYKKTYLKYMESRKVNTRGKAFILYCACSYAIVFLYIAIQKWVLN